MAAPRLPWSTAGMTAPIIAPPLSGKVMGADAESFVIAEWRAEAGPPGSRQLIAPWHVHHKDDEAWYVLEGCLRVSIGGNEVEVRAGAGVFVPRGVPHTYWNPGPEDARYLLTMTTAIYRLIQDIHALPDRNPAALQAVFRKHHSELVEPPPCPSSP